MELLRKNWWVLALQGLLFIALGALVIFAAGFRLSDLIRYLGIILIVFGSLMVFWGWRHRSTQSNWWGLAFIGLLQIIVGVLILADSSRATSVFSYTIGGWATLMGIAQFLMGFGKKSNRLLYFLNGAVSIVMGVLIIYNPFKSAEAMTYLIGFYSLLLGLFIVYYSIKARNFAKKNEQSKNNTPLENETSGETTLEEDSDMESTQ